jgi:hypothetical protein
VKLAAQPHEERSPKWSRKLVSKSSMPAFSELALRYGAGIETETSVPREAYAPFPKWQSGPPESWHGLPWAERGSEGKASDPTGLTPCPEGGAQALAAVVFFVSAFLTMNRSMSSRASSSRICFGGDFMR